MFAAQNQEFNVIDSLSGSVTQWYADVDAAIKKSDVVPGTYEYTITPSYGNVGTLQEGASTNVDITSTRFSLVSVDNSFIRLTQKMTIKVSKALDKNRIDSLYYIGYQYAPEAILQYRIYSNSDLIQTVNWANYEWFLIRNSVQPESKEQSDQYATIDKIRRMDPNVPGVYVDLSALNAADREVEISFDLRIPLNSFLMFRNLRYIPQWAGKITLEIIPSYKNIVIAPCYDPMDKNYISLIPAATLDGTGKDALWALVNANSKDFNVGFHNINQTTKWLITTTGDAADGTGIALQDLKFSCDSQITDKVEIHLATYMLDMEVFNALAAQYFQVPLMFPIQIVESKDFTKQMGTDDTIDNAMTVQLKHADGMYTVFRKDIHSHSCFENPEISFQFNIDGKYYPRAPFNSVNDLRTTNQTLDALNFNNCLTTSINKDTHNSMQPFRYYYDAPAAGGNLNTVASKKIMYQSGDRSNFCIGIPLCDGEDFMGGISTSGTVQVQITGHRLNTNPDPNAPNIKAFGAPIAIFTEDVILKVRSTKPPGTPQISLTHASIEQIIAAAGSV
jgi:hypothetical protein